MSEYQSYEFLALDRQLTAREMADLRSISTRAEITPTRFWNEYEWGDLKADAGQLLARYFDAHLYVTNWGTRRLMLRLPARSVDIARLKPYFRGGRTRLTQSGTFVVLDLWSHDDHEHEDWLEAPRLATLVPVRSLLLQGDLRAAYLAWLCKVQAGELDEDQHEPPVPVGLARMTPPLANLAKFLRLDPDLVGAAAESSGPGRLNSNRIRTWITRLAPSEKDRWLLRTVGRPESAIGTEILAAFRKQRGHDSRNAVRTVAEIRASAERVRAARVAKVGRGNRRPGGPVISAAGSRSVPRRSRGRAPGRRATAR